MDYYFLLEIIALFDSQLHWTKCLRFFPVDDSTYPLFANSSPGFLQIFRKRL